MQFLAFGRYVAVLLFSSVTSISAPVEASVPTAQLTSADTAPRACQMLASNDDRPTDIVIDCAPGAARPRIDVAPPAIVVNF